jgi:hypothetical protein
MSVQTAELVFYSIAGVMAAVWLWGTLFAFRRLKAQGRGEYDVALSPEDDAADTVIGAATVEGDAEAVSKKIAEQLVAGTSMGGMSPLEITGRTAELVTFKRSMGPGGPAAVFDEGLFRLKPDGGNVRVQYAVSMKRFAKIMKVVTYLVCFLWGGIWVIGVPVFIWMYIVHHANASVRWQTLQALQMVHGVWPPFLVGFLGGKLRRVTARFFETFLSNLQHIT